MGSTILGLIVGCSLIGSTVYAQNPPRVVEGEYLIKFKASSGGPAVAQMKLQGKANLKGSYPGLGLMEISMKAGAEGQAHYQALKQDPDVEYIEPNYILEKSEVAANGPVDVQSYDQVVASGVVNTSPSAYAQSSASVGVAESWPYMTSLSQYPTKVVVAVVDTGLDATHDVFKSVAQGGTGALWVNTLEANGRAGIDDDQNGFVDDINGWNFITNTNNFADDDNHGTHVAGIVVGAGLNIFSRPLQESKISVMPLKFLGAGGSGSTSNAIRAIYYAVNNGARVISNSWGGSSYSRALHDAIIYAYDRHVLVVSAAGNYGSNNDTSPIYPANYDVPSNISIASTSRYDDLSSFSNFGEATVALGSPGEYIDSTVPGNMTMKMSGTSMATPLISGLSALALREAPALSGYQIKTLLTQTSQSVTGLSRKVSSGGRINALAFIQTSKQMVAMASSQPVYNPSYSAERSIASTSTGGGTAGGCGLIKAVTESGPGQGGGGASGSHLAVVFGLLLAPVALWQMLRRREGKENRRFERFKMNSEIRVNVGDRELVGAVSTISEGGLSFNADAALEKGGIVTMRIQSPDGREVIEVQGQVVWNEQNHAYGVQFANTRQSTVAMIRDWTANLVKT